MASLQLIVAELRRIADGGFDAQLAKSVAPVSRQFAPVIRAAILNIPVKGLVPYKQPPGLRIRIARCVVAWGKADGPLVQTGVAMDPSRMPSGQYSLPLGMEGVKRWRHPVFGNRENWVTQGPHPYFYAWADQMGPATRKAIERAVAQVAQQVDNIG